ncbi:MAG TPA: alpha/beta fold hydrolase [Polyangia bacterium]|jgi:poly(3-hydroxybutyrate) depolymerase|nr:alpha/beta fold hydrolase [Polyangia bacterium]
MHRLKDGQITLALILAVSLPATFSAHAAEPERAIRLGNRTTAIAYQHQFHNEALKAWRRRAPQVRLTRIRSSADGQLQSVLWYAPKVTGPRPLLVVLHSWSADFTQNLDIPYAEFALANGWAMIHPDFRGGDRRPQATASDLANQDVIDAVTFARHHTTVDDDRIYLVGYSGGAMESLVLAGQHPELWAGVAAWGGIYDVAGWYHEDHGRDVHYRGEIAASCGGVPDAGTPAEAECRKRSPMSFLAQGAGRVPVLIAHGLRDYTVHPHHALSSYNALADPHDRIEGGDARTIEHRRQIPADLSASSSAPPFDELFQQAGAPLRLARHSRSVTLFLYDGNHDMVYNVALRWLSEQRRPHPAQAHAETERQAARQPLAGARWTAPGPEARAAPGRNDRRN